MMMVLHCAEVPSCCQCDGISDEVEGIHVTLTHVNDLMSEVAGVHYN